MQEVESMRKQLLRHKVGGADEIDRRDTEGPTVMPAIADEALLLVGDDASQADLRLRISEAQCRLTAEAAERANRAKSDFLARMSHEIRTPLTAMIALGYLLEKTALSEEQSAYLSKIQLAGRLLLGIVNNTLDLSKIEAGEMLLNKEPFDPAELLGCLRQMLGEQAAAKGIELIVPPAPMFPSMIVGDMSRLLQILVNLVGNAIKFTAAGRVIVKLTMTSCADRVLLRCEVQDTGIGIEPRVIERLFEPYRQADVTTARRFGGTGLGLSISRALVDLMGGSIGVDSMVGVGSTFWFEVPLEFTARKRTAALPASSRGPVPGALFLTGVRVLVVDDCDIVLGLVRRILADRGAIVACRSDGDAAVEYVHAHREQLDIVLIDVQMPMLDGNAATRRIRGDLGLKTLPIVGMTAGTLLGERQNALDAGMNDVITKPFDPELMLSTVRFLVGHAPRQAAEQHS
jgi:signal transduction histidine kinase